MSTMSSEMSKNNKLLLAISILEKMIPEIHLEDISEDQNFLPMTIDWYKQVYKTKPSKQAKKQGKHIIQLSILSHADTKLLLKKYSELATTVQQRLVLFMRLTKRDQPMIFEKHKKWFPKGVKIFTSDYILRPAPDVTVKKKLIDWDRKTIPYLQDTVLKSVAIQFSQLNSDHRNLLIEYINLFAEQRPLDIIQLKTYIEKKDPKNPLLTMTNLSKLKADPSGAKKWVEITQNNSKKDKTIIAPGKKLSGWDGLTVPYLTEESLKNNANCYTKWQHEKKLCFLKYLCLLNKTYPQQTLMLTVYLERNCPYNPLLQLSPLAEIKTSLTEQNTTIINATDVIEIDTNTNEQTEKEEVKSELMDIGDTSLKNTSVKNNSLNLNATMPHNKIVLNLNFKNSKFKNNNRELKETTVPQADVAIRDESDLYCDENSPPNSFVCILSDNEESTSELNHFDVHSDVAIEEQSESYLVDDVLLNDEEDATLKDNLNTHSFNQICETTPMNTESYMYNESNFTLNDFL